MKKIDLCGKWRLMILGENVYHIPEEWMEAEVPGSVYGTLLKLGKMPDPYYRDNELDATKLMENDFVYETDMEITQEMLACDGVILRFEGIDTLGEVYLNDTLLGHVENMHRVWEYALMAVASEAVTILAASVYRILGQRRGRFEAGGVYMLPQVVNEKSLDCSIGNNLEEVVEFRKKLVLFCADNNISEHNAKILGLAVEEIAANIVQYGYKGNRRHNNEVGGNKKVADNNEVGGNTKVGNKKYFMDISFTIQDDKYILRIRDDGVPFNPLEYSVPEGDVTVGGIALLKKIMSNFEYMRVLNMNNTVVELKNM